MSDHDRDFPCPYCGAEAAPHAQGCTPVTGWAKDSPPPPSEWSDLDALRPPKAEDEGGTSELAQIVREVLPECSTEDEFLESMGFGSVCERCGKTGLDDDGYTDCELVPGAAGEDGPWDLVCHECLHEERDASDGGAS